MAMLTISGACGNLAFMTICFNINYRYYFCIVLTI